MAWTKEQQAAIDSRGQTLLLSAAAGSGKTAVLVERIIQRLLSADDPVDITSLLVVTFTKAAAAEMRERVASALMKAAASAGPEVAERQLALLPSAHISTLHSFCQDVIRRYFYTIDLDPDFSIAAEEELHLLRRSVLESVFLSYYEDDEKARLLYPLADMFSSDRGDDALMSIVSAMYNYSRSMAWPEAWLDASAAAYGVPDGAPLDTLPWVRPILSSVHRILEEDVRKYDRVLAQLNAAPALAGGVEMFQTERDLMAQAAECTTWDETREQIRFISFARLKAMRKLDVMDKAIWEECKAVREGVKKDIKDELQATYFSASADEWITGVRTMAPIMKGLVALTKDFAAAYTQAKREKNWIDFSDLEHYCLRILLDPSSTPQHVIPSAAAEELKASFAEVLIDEYQDTNGVQELITQLVSRENNRFMVGDMKQSIYRFRLADPTLFLEKYQSFSRDEGALQRCIDLSRNFRSAAVILDGVNAVFEQAMTRDAADMDYGEREKLYAGRESPDNDDWVGGPTEVHLIDVADSQDDEDVDGTDGQVELTAFEKECAFVARRLRQLKDSGKLIAKKDGTLEPLAYRHMVILLRSLAGKADTMLQALSNEGIPAYAEQNGGYFAAIEVQVMTALLRIIDNPEQDLPMAAVLRSPIVDVDDATLASLRMSGDGTLWQALPAFGEDAEGALGERLRWFCAMLEQWRTFSRRHSVAELLQRLYDDTGYYDYVGAMPGGTGRQANLQALYGRAAQYEAAGFRGVFRYLQLMDRMKDDGLDLAPAQVLGEGEDVVRVMTIHKSKGLEFPVVVIADMAKGFNRQDTRSSILFHNRLGIGIKQYDPQWRMFMPTLLWSGIGAQIDWENTAEEERVLYVAMTRARDLLILTGTTKDPDADWDHWEAGIDPAQANCYWDWVMPVVTKAVSPDGGIVAEGDSPLWHFYLDSGTMEDMAELDEACREEPRLASLQRGGPVDTIVPVWLETNLSWRYGHEKAVETAAKFSVSEIKRQYQMDHMEELTEAASLAVQAAPQAAADTFGEMPAWLRDEEETVTGAQRGTVLHKVMQYLPIRSDWTAATVRRQLGDWEVAGLFTPEETKLVYVPAVLAFCQSDLGQRLAVADEVHREYAFTALFSGGEYLPDPGADEEILVQGVLDCIFREKGQWIIVDYKTDRLEDDEDFRQRYAIQLALYKRAVEQIAGVTVGGVYIYSFHLQHAIEC